MKKSTRRVKRRNNQINVNKQVVKVKSPAATLKKVPAAAKKTKTRRYLLYAVGCLLLMQVIKYVVYSFIFVGPDTPGGLPFLLVIYTQTGLMLAAVGFVVAASISYLRRLSQT
jgi:hypothetical protein